MIHTFLRSIGFGDLTKNADLYLILESILNRPDEQNIVKDEYGNEFACFSKSFGTDIGITVCGNFINDKNFVWNTIIHICMVLRLRPVKRLKLNATLPEKPLPESVTS